MFNLSAFLSYVLVVTFTPGPNNLMCMANAKRYGFKKTLNFIAGVFAGFLMLLLLSSYFNLVLFNIIPKVKALMGILGSLFMLYLAIKIIKSDNKEDKAKKDTEENIEKNDYIITEKENRNLFYTGLTMQFINPKGIIYCITVISNFIIPYFNSKLILILFVILLTLITSLSNLSWALFGVLFNKFLAKYSKAFNIAMGLLLIYSAISISGITQLFK